MNLLQVEDLAVRYGGIRALRGLSPHPAFDVAFYLCRRPEVAEG